MLFSEPKIPQYSSLFSGALFTPPFQCSSASRKFLNPRSAWRYSVQRRCFSALQRAENSSIQRHCGADVPPPTVSVLFSEPKIPQLQRDARISVVQMMFQCSSASRKFLNRSLRLIRLVTGIRFSALQRAENSSIGRHLRPREICKRFQCSSASRKFLNERIPHAVPLRSVFQCSSASRKFLNSHNRLRA